MNNYGHSRSYSTAQYRKQKMIFAKDDIRPADGTNKLQIQNHQVQLKNVVAEHQRVLQKKDIKIKALETALNNQTKQSKLSKAHDLEVLAIRKREAQNFQAENAELIGRLKEMNAFLQSVVIKKIEVEEKLTDLTVHYDNLEVEFENLQSVNNDIISECDASKQKTKDTLEKNDQLTKHVKEMDMVLREAVQKATDAAQKNRSLAAKVGQLTEELKAMEEAANRETIMMEKLMEPVHQFISNRKRRASKMTDMVDLTEIQQLHGSSEIKRSRYE